jgi:hypothetical protein
MNVYVAKNRIIDVEENVPSITHKILESELAKTAAAEKKRTKK